MGDAQDLFSTPQQWLMGKFYSSSILISCWDFLPLLILVSLSSRVVDVLPSIGKQFFKVLLRTRRDGWTPPAPADWLHGYIPGRRRESAILIRQATTWRLERLGLNSLTASHDLTNAFGSVKWEAMDRAAGPNHLLGQQRYRLATTTIPGQ